jgi:hypothetical protein
MRNATLRKLVIIVSSVAALGGGLGIDPAYAQGGGGFDRGGGGIAHMGVGFGGDQMGGFGEDPIVASSAVPISAALEEPIGGRFPARHAAHRRPQNIMSRHTETSTRTTQSGSRPSAVGR